MVHTYSKDEKNNKFAIGYIIKPLLHINKVFREQVEKFLRSTFNESTKVTIRGVMKNNDTCVIALIMFYETNGTKPKRCMGYSVVYFILSLRNMFELNIYIVNQKIKQYLF